MGAGSADGPAQKSATEAKCLGLTVINPATPTLQGSGDYLEIAALQPGTGTSTTVLGVSRICGVIFDAATPNTATAQATACSFARPFRVGVHFDEADSIQTAAIAANPNLDVTENAAAIVAGEGRGYQGFYLNYWQNSC